MYGPSFPPLALYRMPCTLPTSRGKTHKLTFSLVQVSLLSTRGSSQKRELPHSAGGRNKRARGPANCLLCTFRLPSDHHHSSHRRIHHHSWISQKPPATSLKTYLPKIRRSKTKSVSFLQVASSSNHTTGPPNLRHCFPSMSLKVFLRWRGWDSPVMSW